MKTKNNKDNKFENKNSEERDLKIKDLKFEEFVNKKNDDLEEINLWKDRFLRISAEFDNFKKRTERDKAYWIESAQLSLLKELLILIDDFDRALKQKNSENAELFVGIEIIYKSFIKILENYSVKEFSDYKKFDPELHEAMANIESKDHKSDYIVDILQKGFRIKDKVLRVAKVIVAK